MQYPGHIIQLGEEDTVLLDAIRHKLRLDGTGAVFDEKLQQAVMLFQSQHVDNSGRPLRIDGRIGALTWEAMFGEDAVTRNSRAGNDYLIEVLRVAASAADKPVRESPSNSNRGPDVDSYLESVGKPPGLAWCVAFVYFCFNTAATTEGRANPMVRTAGVLDHWNRCAIEKGAKRIAAAQAVDNPAVVHPGMIFVMDHGGGLGHSGLIEHVAGGLINTIEGNINAAKGREGGGGGVYRLSRKIADINTGFVDYASL